jgi:hypothetical protein
MGGDEYIRQQLRLKLDETREGFPHFAYVVEHTLEADSGYGRQLQDALDHLHSLALSMDSEKLRELVPRSLAHTLETDYE